MEIITAAISQISCTISKSLASVGKVVLTPLLWLLGFTSKGPAPASIAASWMACGVRAGGGTLFSLMQSIAMGGKHGVLCAAIGLLAIVLVWLSIRT